MGYTNSEMSTLLRDGADTSREPSAAEGWADWLNNPAYLAHWEVVEPSMELATGGEAEDKTLTESMGAASISDSASVVSTYTTPATTSTSPDAAAPRALPAGRTTGARNVPSAASTGAASVEYEFDRRTLHLRGRNARAFSAAAFTNHGNKCRRG